MNLRQTEDPLAEPERPAQTASGATWVSLHHGGGVGMGYSQHSGVVVADDDTDDAAAGTGAVERPGDGRHATRMRGMRRRLSVERHPDAPL